MLLNEALVDFSLEVREELIHSRVLYKSFLSSVKLMQHFLDISSDLMSTVHIESSPLVVPLKMLGVLPLSTSVSGSQQQIEEFQRHHFCRI